MARARSIKPGFFLNTRLAKLPMAARMLFAGLWCQCDRAGRIEDDSNRIKATVLPYDRVDVEKLLKMLAEGEDSFVIRYEYEDKRYIQIRNWGKHQNPHAKEQASVIPAPDMPRASLGLVPEKAGLVPEIPALALPVPLTLNPVPCTLNPEPCNGNLNPEPRARTVPASEIWAHAGFEGPEDFAAWWTEVYRNHPTRGEPRIAEDYARQAILAGTLERHGFEEVYAACRSSGAWQRAQGRFIPKLSTWMNDKGWMFPPAEVEEKWEWKGDQPNAR